MPRTARASQGGYCYHVINRGNARANVFHKDADYQAFVRLFGEACQRLPLRVPVPRGGDWLEHVERPQSEAGLRSIRDSVNRASPHGSDRWRRATAQRLSLESTLRPRGRPRSTAKK